MAHLLLVYGLICLGGFVVYKIVNFILWCIGGIEEDEDEE
jgi:hypothetical protein